MAEFSIAIDGIWISVDSPAGEFRCCFPDVPRKERQAFAKRLREHDKRRVELNKWDRLTNVSNDPDEVKRAAKHFEELSDLVGEMNDELNESPWEALKGLDDVSFNGQSVAIGDENFKTLKEQVTSFQIAVQDAWLKTMSGDAARLGNSGKSPKRGRKAR